jgi:hypothetical protein
MGARMPVSTMLQRPDHDTGVSTLAVRLDSTSQARKPASIAYMLPCTAASTSDTPLTTRELRAAVLWHALVSYLFGALIIGASVNFVVSLAS